MTGHGEHQIQIDVVYPRSSVCVPVLTIGPDGIQQFPLHLTAEESWVVSECSDCGLPLSDHPPERSRRSRRKYCRIARRRQ